MPSPKVCQSCGENIRGAAVEVRYYASVGPSGVARLSRTMEPDWFHADCPVGIRGPA